MAPQINTDDNAPATTVDTSADSNADTMSAPLVSYPDCYDGDDGDLVIINRTGSFSRVVYQRGDHKVTTKGSADAAPTSPRSRKPEPVSDLQDLMSKFAVMLSRSSGRDKFASMLQYGSILVGNQPFVHITDIPNDRHAPWVRLEDSMSSGRKVFRLFKWIKELERVERSAFLEGQMLARGCSATERRVTKVLELGMNVGGFLYYFVDNFIWAASVGLINRTDALPSASDANHLRDKLLGRQLQYDEYIDMQTKHQQTFARVSIAKARVSKWRDWKNWSSMFRLLLAITYGILQLRTLQRETGALKRAQSAADVRKRDADKHNNGWGNAGDCSTSDDNDSASDNDDERNGSIDEASEAERESAATDARVRRLQLIREMRAEQIDDMTISFCNLGILLKRLRLGLFHHIPQWGVGLFGVVAALIGMSKNWPSKPKSKPVPKAKPSKPRAASSSSSASKQRPTTDK